MISCSCNLAQALQLHTSMCATAMPELKSSVSDRKLQLTSWLRQSTGILEDANSSAMQPARRRHQLVTMRTIGPAEFSRLRAAECRQASRRGVSSMPD